MLAGKAPAAEFTQCTVDSTNGIVQLEWSETTATNRDGFGLQKNTDLMTSNWVAAGEVDLWPSSTTNWSAYAEAPQTFYQVRHAERGRLESTTFIGYVSPTNLTSIFRYYGLDTNQVHYPVAMIAVVYETFDHRNLSDLASGLLLVPTKVPGSSFPEPPARVPMISLQHGTLCADQIAPSEGRTTADVNSGMIFATGGYAVSMPDYPGMGNTSPGLHPYLHARSEAVASVDMLRAVLQFMKTAPLPQPNGRLFIAGYSQGGHATLALQRELETFHAKEFPLAASAPMAGPHDLSGTMQPLIFSGQAYNFPAYVPYSILGLNSVYHFGTCDDFFKPPYADSLPSLFDGSHYGSEISAQLPTVPAEILTDAFISNAIGNTNDPFVAALRKNDTYRDWVPTAPTHFYHCASDDIVPYSNSVVAVNAFLNAGASSNLVQLIDPLPSATHTGGFFPSIFACKEWFDTLKEE